MIDSSRKARGKSERKIVTTKTRCRQGSRFLSNLLRFLLNVLYGPSLVVPFDNADYFLVPNDNTTVNQRKNRSALDCQVVWNLAYCQIILEGLKDCFCTLFFRSRTSLQCFALDSRCSKAKHCRDVLGRVLGRKNKVQNPSFNLIYFYPKSEMSSENGR